MDRCLETEIVIVGAGLVGLAAAIAFTLIGKRVVLVDAKKTILYTPEHWDARIYALTPANQQWLQTIGVWDYVDTSRVNAIHAMHLWEQAITPHDENKPLVLSDEDAHVPRMGLIIENQNLLNALWQRLHALAITVIEEVPWQTVQQSPSQVILRLADERQIAARLLVVADGAQSALRDHLHINAHIKPFDQLAIVANFIAEKPHGDVARQWFAPHETLALLPLPQGYVSMVWSLSTESAQALLKLNQQDFTQAVQTRAHAILGDLQLCGDVLAFPLHQIVPKQLIEARVALVGDAAHQVHPMAGQGVNLGFRDVQALAAVLTARHAMQDIGEKTLLRQYERARKADVTSMNALIDGLDSLFASEQGILCQSRGWGMQQLNHLTVLKRLLIQQAVA